MTKKLIIYFLSCLLPLLLLSGCFKKKAQKAEIPARPVQTATVIQKDVPIYIDSFGTLASFNNVDVKSQVTGEIKEVHFNEGAEVSAGDLLFTIDPREYQADLDKATAALAADKVNLKLKRDTLERNQKLIAKNLISQQDYETYQTDVAAAEAQVQLDNANIETAKINLEYCSICSPINGLTGRRQVDLGNIVIANNGPTLVNIKTIDPLYVDFTVSERHLPQVRKAMAKEKLDVEIIIPGDSGSHYTGTLECLDNTVDDDTGTISLRAIVPNKERALWAGQFINVRLILGTKKNALLAPYESVQLGQKGPYLFAVTADNKADLRLVTIGSRQGDDIVIEKGVANGEKVVTTGQMGLSPGVPVAEVSQQK